MWHRWVWFESLPHLFQNFSIALFTLINERWLKMTLSLILLTHAYNLMNVLLTMGECQRKSVLLNLSLGENEENKLEFALTMGRWNVYDNQASKPSIAFWILLWRNITLNVAWWRTSRRLLLFCFHYLVSTAWGLYYIIIE